MSLNIIDNFKYLGKKYLDSRQSFNTLEEMKNCNTVPDGFITYCNEDKKRYAYDSANEATEKLGKWRVYLVDVIVGEDGETTVIQGGSNAVVQPDEPEDEEAIWFDTDGENTISISDNAIIAEMKEIIKALTQEVRDLKARVDYLEVNGGSRPSNPSDPEIPDDPIIPEGEFDILLEDGTSLLLEDGTPLQLEEQVSIKPSNENGLLLESGKNILLEDGTNLLLE